MRMRMCMCMCVCIYIYIYTHEVAASSVNHFMPLLVTVTTSMFFPEASHAGAPPTWCFQKSRGQFHATSRLLPAAVRCGTVLHQAFRARCVRKNGIVIYVNIYIYVYIYIYICIYTYITCKEDQTMNKNTAVPDPMPSRTAPARGSTAPP